MEAMLGRINDPDLTPALRLEALTALERERTAPAGGNAAPLGEVNNHIHTIYSFSPYTPAMAAWRAREAGLAAAGSVDHDSIGAAQELLDACAILGIGGCVGFELRVSFKSGPFADRKLNNPDSRGIAYMTVQGIPRDAIPRAAQFLKPIQAERNRRNRAMVDAMNAILAEKGLGTIDFARDVEAISQAAHGGSITERHLLAALSNLLIDRFGKGPALVVALGSILAIPVPAKIQDLLTDEANQHYLFDLLGLLKSSFLENIFIQPNEKECLSAREVVNFALSIGAIPAYAYLGDVGESPTGDKRAEQFEDGYLDELFACLKAIGYRAVTYMPPRNTIAQLLRVQELCARHGFMEISGVDINSSRQAFTCPAVLKSEFRHLLDTTWALIAHERLSSVDPDLGLFSAASPFAQKPLADRLALYAGAGRELNLHSPYESAAAIARRLRSSAV